MKDHTTNYYNTFISVAPDCPVSKGTIPPERNGELTIAGIEFKIMNNHDYQYTSDDVLFEVFSRRKGVPTEIMGTERLKYFSKGQPCFRASPLTKKYGWGIHCDADGKIAMIPMESEAYQKFSTDPGIKQVAAMRSSKKH
ncbi:DUF6157 family protein [Robertkochia solimangrovi]|uniref:DUF6157 family protein n=1 Tax=Robertkochia solimangrovi TaxID=2213046 RepID=UPI0011800BA1|nr:DUF6157 family protein [Robertkochia solimangrovi]TRZ43520.1 hypothetical protein DMZ48_08830 [Robertkochia solimangrovi]